MNEKLKTLLAELHNEISSHIDGRVKARTTKGLNRLILAGQAVEKAEKHLVEAFKEKVAKAA